MSYKKDSQSLNIPPGSIASTSFSPGGSRRKKVPETVEEVEYHLKFINPLFQTASHIVQTRLPASGPIQPTYKEKLLLYSFFKQAVKGDVQKIASRPGLFDMLGRAKWDSWKKLEGLQPVDTKKLYVDTLLKMLKKHSDTPEARILIESLEGFAPSVARSDFSSGNSEESSPRPPLPPEDEEKDLEDSDSISSDEASSQSRRQPPSILGPYVTRAQLPDPVNVHQTNLPLRNPKPVTREEIRTHDRPVSRTRTESTVASRQRSRYSDHEPSTSRDTRRLSRLQLEALVSRPVRVSELGSQRSWGQPESHHPSAAICTAIDDLPEQENTDSRQHSDRSELPPPANACSDSSIPGPIPTSPLARVRDPSESESRANWRDVVKSTDRLQTAISALQARVEKLEELQSSQPPQLPARSLPFRWQDLLNSNMPHQRLLVIKQWLVLAGRPFLSTLAHLIFICASIYISGVIGRLGQGTLRFVWSNRFKRIRNQRK